MEDTEEEVLRGRRVRSKSIEGYRNIRFSGETWHVVWRLTCCLTKEIRCRPSPDLGCFRISCIRVVSSSFLSLSETASWKAFEPQHAYNMHVPFAWRSGSES